MVLQELRICDCITDEFYYVVLCAHDRWGFAYLASTDENNCDILTTAVSPNDALTFSDYRDAVKMAVLLKRARLDVSFYVCKYFPDKNVILHSVIEK